MKRTGQKALGLFIAGYVLLASLMCACNTNGCLENRNSVPLAGFYSSPGGLSIAMDSIEIIGLGMPADDPLSPAGRPIKSIYLPMRSTQPSTSWVFSYKWKYLDFPQLNDTIVFEYTSTPFFASNECGVIYKYHIDHMAYTTHLIDSIALLDSMITNQDVEKIKIYFRTASEEE